MSSNEAYFKYFIVAHAYMKSKIIPIPVIEVIETKKPIKDSDDLTNLEKILSKRLKVKIISIQRIDNETPLSIKKTTNKYMN